MNIILILLRARNWPLSWRGICEIRASILTCARRYGAAGLPKEIGETAVSIAVHTCGILALNAFGFGLKALVDTARRAKLYCVC